MQAKAGVATERGFSTLYLLSGKTSWSAKSFALSTNRGSYISAPRLVESANDLPSQLVFPESR